MMKDTPDSSNGEARPMIDWALEYHRRGWSLIPIKPGEKKTPKGFKWKPFQTSRANEENLREWFDARDDLNLAVVSGEVSGGLVCRDFDKLEAYEQWAAAHPELAKTLPTVRTARGWHVYFRTALGLLIYRSFDDGEYRGDSGHYSVVPPSRHPSGATYTWRVPLPKGEVPFVSDPCAAGLLPSAAVHETQKAQEVPGKSHVVCGGTGGVERASPAVQEAIEDAIRRTIPPHSGTRRAKLFELARRLLAISELAGIPATEIDFLKPSIREWWTLAKPHTSGKHPHFQQSWQDFVFAWEEARIPFGATMKAIYEQAIARTPPRKAVEKYGARSCRTQLAALCRELQDSRRGSDGAGSFYLSGRTAATVLPVSDVQAWRWIRQLEADGIIKTIKTNARSTRLATEYRYLGD